MMERELAVPWEDVFSDIDPEPLAAGTIAQVHRARMADGHRVVVKVQRPDAEEVVETDLALLEMIVGPASRSRRLNRIIDLPSLAEQVSRALRDELDFGEEARNIVRMGEIVEGYDRIGVPRCHRELSTRRLLVMDEVVGGVPLLEAPEGPERIEAARQLMQAYYKQVLEEGFFHADPHPGNMLWADGRIWLLDLGMVGRLDAETRRQLFLIMLAFAQGDVDLLADVSLDLSEVDDGERGRRRELPRGHRRGDRRAPRPLAAGHQPGRAAQPADGDLGPPRCPPPPPSSWSARRSPRSTARSPSWRRSSTRSTRRGGSSSAASRGGSPAASTRSRSSTRRSGCATGRARSPTGWRPWSAAAPGASSRSSSPRRGSSRRSSGPAVPSRSGSAPGSPGSPRPRRAPPTASIPASRAPSAGSPAGLSVWFAAEVARNR